MEIKEHMEVVGSDGEHVGIVDHFDAENIKLTRNDSQAHGAHHLVAMSLVASVDSFVRLSVSAQEAKQQWTQA